MVAASHWASFQRYWSLLGPPPRPHLAVWDVFYLQRALVHAYKRNDDRYLAGYSDMALRRVWPAERLSWWLTNLLHRFPSQDGFDRRIRQDEFDHPCASEAAQAVLAEQYAGLPFEG